MFNLLVFKLSTRTLLQDNSFDLFNSLYLVSPGNECNRFAFLSKYRIQLS